MTERTEPVVGESVVAMVRRRALRMPSVPAIVDGARSLAYAELLDAAARITALVRAHGAGPNARVGLLARRSADAVASIVGILSVGAAYVPLDPEYPRSRRQAMADGATLDMILFAADCADALPQLAGPAVAIASALDVPPAALGNDDPCAADAIAYVLFTSGSTGRPKAIAMPHGPLSALISWQDGALFQGRPASLLHASSLGFDASFNEIFSTLCCGGTLHVADDATRADPLAFLEQVCARDIDRLMLSFSALQQLAEASIEQSCFPLTLREVCSTAEPLRITSAVRTLFERMPSCRLFNQYGPSETHVVTTHELRGPAGSWPSLPPIGRACSVARVYVLDRTGEPAPPGALGEMHVGGDCLANGYLGQPRLTAERFVPDPFAARPGSLMYRTGDLARVGAGGALEFCGRADHQVKVRGHRVELGEIEAALSGHGDIAQSVVVPTQDAWGDTVVAAFVRPRSPALHAAGVRAFLAERLPAYMIPARVTVVSDFPLSPNGKIDVLRLMGRREPRVDSC